MFPMIHVDSRSAIAIEPLGTKSKFWYREDRRRILFKAEERGTGEDWAEKISCELCALLGLPHVHYELALDVKRDIPGVVCESCVPRGQALALGNQLLLDRDPAYPVDKPKYRVEAHTVEAVCQVLEQLAPPAPHWMDGAPSGIVSALDVFTGYVILDAWIANQDRHHENWGAVCQRDCVRLAPTFDHGASLARNLSDSERHKRLTSQDVGYQIGTFVQRAKSAFYVDGDAAQPLSTLDAWLRFSERQPDAAAIWKKRLADIQLQDVKLILDNVPPDRMSAICQEFTLRLLEENRTRLLREDIS